MLWLPPRRGLRAAVIGALVAAVSTAGCGTSVVQRDSRYADQLTAADASFNAEAGSAMTATRGFGARERTARALGRYEVAVADVDTRLRKLRPPITVSPLHRQLVRAIDHYGADIRRAIVSLKQTDRSRLSVSEQRFRRATAAVQRSEGTIVAKIRARLLSTG